MKDNTKLVLLFIIVIMFACGLNLWAENSPVVYDYRHIHKRNTERDLGMAFATALRINHPAAYDMIDPNLKPRLDEWMNSHQSEKCRHIPEVFQIGIGTKRGSQSVLSCFGPNGWILFNVDNIVIKDMKVIDWGEVTENGD